MHGISVQTLIQSATDPEFRGRMLSLWGLITRAFPALGALALGIAGEVFGLRIPTLVAVGLFLGVFAWGLSRLGRWSARWKAAPRRRGATGSDGVMLDAAIVGMGRWGRVLVDSVQGRKGTGLRFVAGCTGTPEKARDYAAQQGIRLLGGYDAVLADPR